MKDGTMIVNWEGYEVNCEYTYDPPKVTLWNYSSKDRFFNRTYRHDPDVEQQLKELIAIEENEYDEGDLADEKYELSRENH